MSVQLVNSSSVLGLGEFPPEQKPDFLVVRLKQLGNYLSKKARELPVLGDSVLVTTITTSLKRAAQAIGRLARPVLSRILNVAAPISTSVLGLDPAKYGVVPLGHYTDQNDVLVTKDGADTTDWRLKLLASAQQRVLLSGNYCGGAVFNRCLDVLEERLREKPDLEVFILSSEELLEARNLDRIRDLQERYPSRFKLMVTPLLAELAPHPRTIENHVKMMVVDEKYWMLGGTGVADHLCTKGELPPEDMSARNFAQRLVAKSTRDMDLIGRGASARTMALEFFKLWALYEHRCYPHNRDSLVNHYIPVDPSKPLAVLEDFDSSADLIKKVPCKVLVCGPEHPRNACTEEYDRLIRSAQKVLRLAQMNMNPPKVIKRSLNELAPGVHVELITNGVRGNSPSTNHFFAWPNVRQYLPILLRGRLHQARELLTQNQERDPGLVGSVYEYDVENVLYHKKVVLVDDAAVAVGSYNLSEKSDRSDHEIMVSLYSPEVAAHFNTVLDKDRELSREVSLERATAYYHGHLHRFVSELQKFILGPFVV